MLVGRESELRTITTLLAGARVGDSRALVLSGEAGIGKSALLAAAESHLDGMRALRAQGVESEQFVPFAGLLQVLRPVLPLLRHIAPEQAAALTAALLTGEVAEVEPSRFAVGAATLSLLARAAEDLPLVVLVDDAHLLDSPSAEAILFAARRLVSDAVAILVSIRTGEPGAALWNALPVQAVTGLDLDAAAALLQTTSVPVRREHVARLHRSTAGNPLALLELAHRPDQLVGTPDEAPLAVPEQLRRWFARRAEELSEDARAALLVAAADSASATTVYAACAALGLPASPLGEAVDAQLITLEGDRIEFWHPLVRSAVYGSADPATRRAVHRALAAAVPADETDRLAWHLSEGAVAPDDVTAAVLQDAAEQASARGAHAIAAYAHERAAALSSTPALVAARLAAAGEAAWLAGLTDRSVDLLHRAERSRPDPLLAAHLRELRGAVETRCGSLEAALTTYVEAAQAIAVTHPDTAVRLYADAIHVSFYLGAPGAAMRACAAIERLMTDTSDPHARSLGSLACGMALVLSGSGTQGIEKVRRAAYGLVATDIVPADRFRLPLRLQGALWLREAGPQRAVVGEAIERLRAQAALGSLPYLLMHIARDAATSDRWDDAEAAYLESIQLARETGQSTDLAVSQAGLAVLHARRGRAQECRDDVAAVDDLCRRNHIRLGSFWLEFAQGDLLAGQGDAAGAARHYEALEAALAETGLADPDQSCAPELVETYVHLGRLEDAQRVAAHFARRAAIKGAAWSLARGERALGWCASGATASEHFRRALEWHARTPDRYETARTALAFGSRLRRDRQRVEARTLLRSALSDFERLGAVPWADRAAQELAATGETVHRRSATAMDELTPQERQIAQLLAHGRTTREAAAALFISPKTVEYHLRHVYLKLGIRSREALADVFGR